MIRINISKVVVVDLTRPTQNIVRDLNDIPTTNYTVDTKINNRIKSIVEMISGYKIYK